jgi:hypothetical protein
MVEAKKHPDDFASESRLRASKLSPPFCPSRAGDWTGTSKQHLVDEGPLEIITVMTTAAVAFKDTPQAGELH